MKRASVKANFIYNMTYQVLNILLPLITTPYISSILGAANIGIYSYTYSMVSTFVMIGSLGIGTYGQYEIARCDDDKKAISKGFWEIQAVKTISVSLIFAIYLALTFLYKEYSLYFLIQIPYFIAAILDISWLYQGLENFKLVAIRNIIIKLLSLVAIFTLVKKSEDLVIYILILCLSQVFGNLVMWMQLPKLVAFVKIEAKNIIHHIKPTFIYFIPTVAHQIYAVLSKTMLGAIGQSNEENGFYEQGYKIINMVVTVINAYTVVMRSRMTVYFKRGDTEKIQSSIEKSSHFIAMLVFPMTFGLMATAKNLVPWFFGAGFEKVTYILYVFAPVFIFMGYSRLLGSHILTPSGRQSKSNIAQCFAAAFNVVFNFILIPHLESIGAVISSVCAEIIIVGMYFWFVRKELSVITIIKTSWKKLVASVVMFFVVYPSHNILPATIVGSLCQISIGALVYLLVLLILQDSYLKSTVNSLINKFRRKVK
ncbi:MAG: flippase [Clostridia bacterium]|nr:flippase [Clostridia bacterium]